MFHHHLYWHFYAMFIDYLTYFIRTPKDIFSKKSQTSLTIPIFLLLDMFCSCGQTDKNSSEINFSMLLAFNNRLIALPAHHMCYFHFPHCVL